jgi:signal transduction histidine kinase
MESLFGSLDFCECEECRSVLSPAAYLVDLLRLLDNADVGQALRQRRPDIAEVELTCANTNTTLPDVDLVLEILESAVAFPSPAVQLSAAERTLLDQGTAPGPVRDELARHVRELRGDVTVELGAMRRTIGALRPLVLDQRGLVAAVRELAAATRERAGLAECTVTDDLGDRRLGAELETVLFRVAQQALANVAQHAAAARVSVRLERSGSSAVLRVDDDGRGFDPAHVEVPSGYGGFGLTSMRERVQRRGGQFRIDSSPGQGARIQVQLALSE